MTMTIDEMREVVRVFDKIVDILSKELTDEEKNIFEEYTEDQILAENIKY